MHLWPLATSTWHLKSVFCIALVTAVLRSAAAAAPPTSTSSTNSTALPAYHALHQRELFSSPWVQQNIVLTYAPETTRDGLGAQAFRMLGIYALSKALGVGYLHTPPECIGHIGGLPHYQGRNCSDRMTAADVRKLKRVQQVLVPEASSNSTDPAAVRGWHTERLDDVILTWPQLVNATQTAMQLKRPSVLKLARLQALLCQHPDIFLSIPQLRPTHSQGQQHKGWVHKPWMLRSIRLAVHMRRGDITHNIHHLRRLLPLSYYTNIMQQLVETLGAAGADVALEVYTQRPITPSGRRELAALRAAFPDVVLLLDKDDLWTWQQMATADILVLSLSMYSVVPALLNPDAVIIGPKPEALDGKAMSVMRMPHWYSALDHNGTLPAGVYQRLLQEYGGAAPELPRALGNSTPSLGNKSNQASVQVVL